MPSAGHDKTFKYNYALVSRVPNSLYDKGIRSRDQIEPINIERARLEHEEYVETLRKLGVDVIELPADEKHPDSCFVEDTAVVVNGTALICRPGASARAGEVNLVRTVLRKELKQQIVEIDDSKAFLDGGDVLWTGKEFIVGTGKRTNFQGASAVARAFVEYVVTPVTLPEGAKHLKDYISMGSANCMVVASTDEAMAIYRRIKEISTYSYSVLRVSEDAAANVLFVNGTTVHLTKPEIPASHQMLEQFPRRLEVQFSELRKVDGSLTGCCLLIACVKHPKHIASAVAQADLSQYSTV